MPRKSHRTRNPASQASAIIGTATPLGAAISQPSAAGITTPSPVAAPAPSPVTMLILDKLGLGLIGALIAVLATGAVNQRLEGVRSSNAFRQEVRKTRFTKTAEIWDRLNAYEAAARAASREASSHASSPAWMVNGTPAAIRARQLEHLGELVKTTEDAHRQFWSTYNMNRSYADRATLDQVVEHYRSVRVIDLVGEGELSHERVRAELESHAHQTLPTGPDFVTPAINQAEKDLESTRQTAVDIEKALLDQSQD